MNKGWQFGWEPGETAPPELRMFWGRVSQPPKQDVNAVTRDLEPTTPMRIGDVERDQAVSELGEHFAAGRLNRDEFDERSDQALLARFSTDLAPLFADLPQQQQAAPAPSPRPAVAGPPPWAFALWLLPVMVMVAAVAGAVLLHAPFLIWIAVWMMVIGRITGHQHHARRRLARDRQPPR
ncbi:MAG: DUF1707 domain-containing protein [Microlunatus sp.]|nr:DUF1707 domain-containing protein [Microlunatus sp.]MDN5769924.1 DUF1707 domain-containing protein [Microlunatus sp.]MDN5803340.1 DUF1707 domain-containing protein [Microlunatus sp.]